ncbi:unnamed protein product [Lampetra planeri]
MMAAFQTAGNGTEKRRRGVTVPVIGVERRRRREEGGARGSRCCCGELFRELWCRWQSQERRDAADDRE